MPLLRRHIQRRLARAVSIPSFDVCTGSHELFHRPEAVVSRGQVKQRVTVKASRVPCLPHRLKAWKRSVHDPNRQLGEEGSAR